MNSALPKVLHPLCGVPLLTRVLKTVTALKPFSIGVVVGQGAEEVTKEIGGANGVHLIRQKLQKGSGNAVQCAAPWIRGLILKSPHLMVLCGDTPLISEETLLAFHHYHLRHKNSATIQIGRASCRERVYVLV